MCVDVSNYLHTVEFPDGGAQECVCKRIITELPRAILRGIDCSIVAAKRAERQGEY